MDADLKKMTVKEWAEAYRQHEEEKWQHRVMHANTLSDTQLIDQYFDLTQFVKAISPQAADIFAEQLAEYFTNVIAAWQILAKRFQHGLRR